MLVQLIDTYRSQNGGSIKSLAKLIGQDRQDYYRIKQRIEKQKDVAGQVVSLVKGIRSKMRKIGGKKLYYKLESYLKELKIGRDKFFDILRANRLLIRPKRRYHVTTDSKHRFKKHKNLVEKIEINRPEQVFVSDITYLGNWEDPMYLALVTDAYSKKIMGYDLSNSLGAKGADRALKMSIKNRSYSDKELIHHSDRGVQYCCDLYQTTLDEDTIKCSMTEKYDPYQNAVAERINGILKQEFIADLKITDIHLMQIVIDESILIYNKERPHLSNHMLTPNQMHDQDELKMKTYKSKKLDTDSKSVPSSL